jgi:hypothetical protein
MSEKTLVTVDGPRGEIWERVLGTRVVPVLSDKPVLADLRPAGGNIQHVFMLDLKALNAKQLAALVAYLAETFHKGDAGVTFVEIFDKGGVPIVATNCRVVEAEIKDGRRTS